MHNHIFFLPVLSTHNGGRHCKRNCRHKCLLYPVKNWSWVHPNGTAGASWSQLCNRNYLVSTGTIHFPLWYVSQNEWHFHQIGSSSLPHQFCYQLLACLVFHAIVESNCQFGSQLSCLPQLTQVPWAFGAKQARILFYCTMRIKQYKKLREINCEL